MTDLKGTTAIVTGGTSGIGLATAHALLARGSNVVLNARTASRRRPRTALGPRRDDRHALHLRRGRCEPARYLATLASAAMEEFGRIDIVVHSAGGPAPGTALQISPEAWLDAFTVHVHSAYHLFRAVHPALAVRGGSVVLLSSAAALRGCPGTVAYQVVKASLIAMARALARDHAAENIRVNCVAPGIIRTPFHAAMTDDARANNLANRIPLRREGRPEDVAALIVQLAENDFITGETVAIDGGMSMRMV